MIKLYNGDCTEILNKEIVPEKSIIVTDPPFNVGYKYNTYKDNLNEEDYFNMLKNICSITGDMKAVLVLYPETLHKFSIYTQTAPTRVVSWIYNSNTPRQHRDIGFYGVKPDFTKVIQPYKNPTDKRIALRIANGCLGGKLYDWWDVHQVKNVSKDKTDHPCQMPLEIMENIIGILPEEYTIVDPFLGSGTTGVACAKYNRDFIGVELDKKYFDIASDRINKTKTEEDRKLW